MKRPTLDNSIDERMPNLDSITVEVTADDIANGERRSASKCALAVALTRQEGEPWVVLTYAAYPNRRQAKGRPPLPPIYTIDPDDADWVKEFDINGTVEPRTVTMRRMRSTTIGAGG